MLQAALSESYDRAPIILSDEVRELIRQLTEQADIPIPVGIQATLRPYQERGFSWMYRNFRIGFGSIIADDMGLGKTLQVITISDLPDKIEQNELALLTERQAALYQETLEQAMQAIEGIEATDHQSLFVRQGLVLQMILALKQICNHPALFLKNNDLQPELSGKTEMLLSLLESIVESGQKVLVFTQFREMGDMLQQMIEQRIGHRPRLPYRPASERVGASVHHQEHLRGANRPDDSGQAPSGRYDRSQRRELDRQTEQQ